MKATRAESEMW